MADSVKELGDILPSLNPLLFSKPNVVATGTGYKRVRGKRTGELSVICSVESKVAATALKKSDLIPSSLEGFPTDVHPVGLITPLQSPTSRFRPAPGGVSTGHIHITAGTLGCIVKKGEQLCILSNNHVLANSNNASSGDVILQPGPLDGGLAPGDQIAMLGDFIPIRYENETGGCHPSNIFTGLFNFFAKLAGSGTRLYSRGFKQPGNLVDCALALPIDSADVTAEVLQIGRITGTAEGVLDMKVKKSGRTTGLTDGIIEQVDATVRVNFGAGKTALFTDQLIAGAMSQGGDSGSVVFSEDTEAVGLLFAGSSNTTVINRIQNVFSALDVTLP